MYTVIQQRGLKISEEGRKLHLTVERRGMCDHKFCIRKRDFSGRGTRAQEKNLPSSAAPAYLKRFLKTLRGDEQKLEATQ